MLVALLGAFFVVATALAVVLLGVRAARHQAAIAPEWWIPLFFKAGAVAVMGGGLAVFTVEYTTWLVQDLAIARIVRQATVLNEERQSDRTIYDFDSKTSVGWSRLIRYDFRLVWEEVAAVAAIAGVAGAVASVFSARLAIRLRKRRSSFAVLAPTHQAFDSEPGDETVPFKP